VLQPGNHDVGQNPTAELVREYRERFGDDYYSFWAGGVKYVAFNSQFYHALCEPENGEAAQMAAAQAAWLEKELAPEATAGAMHVVLLSHIAPFMGHEDEPTGHFNWRAEPRAWMLRLIAKCKPVPTLWLSGHYHQNCVVTSRAGVEVVTTGSCGGMINWKQEPAVMATKPEFNFGECVNVPPVTADAFHSGMRLVRVRRDRIHHRWVELGQVPNAIDDELFELSEGDTESKRSSLVSTMLLERFEISMDLPSVDKEGTRSARCLRRSNTSHFAREVSEPLIASEEDSPLAMVRPHRSKTTAM